MSPNQQFYKKLFALHKRILAGDPTALADIARHVFDRLIGQLRSNFLHVDDHLLQERVADALLEYGRAPQGANAATGAGVLGFLVLRAKSRVFDSLRSERARQEAEADYAREVSGLTGNLVELRFPGSEHSYEERDSGGATTSPEIEERLDRATQLTEVVSGARNALDRQLLQLMLDGVRATSEYARVLGIEDEPIKEQRRIVKQHKDRLKVAMMRRQETKSAGPKRRGRPPRSDDTGGGHG